MSAPPASYRSVGLALTTDTQPTLLLLGQALGHEQGAASGAAPAAGPVDWPLLVALASHHLVTPALHLRLNQVAGPLDRELHGYLAVMRSLNRARNRRIRAQLEHLVGALNVVGIEPVLLKGTAHLLLGLYADDADRVIGDIDLLVARENCDAALAVLLAAGYAPHAGDLEHAHLHHYPPIAAADGSEAWVELHKAASPYHRALPTPTLIRRARRIRIGSGWAAAPCPEDLLVHNIVHSQLHNRGFWSAEFGLREAYDLVRLARHFRDELDWTRLAARIDADVGKHSAGFYVRRAHHLFGQDPPPLAWPWGARLADRRWRLHAQGKMRWLQRASRLIAHELQLVSYIVHDPAWRRRPARRLLDPGWYGRHLRSLRGTARRWRPDDRPDLG